MVLALTVLLYSTPPAYSQSANAPAFAIGDSWTRKSRDSTYTISVIKVEEAGTWFRGGIQNCAGCLSLYDTQLTLLKLTRPDGSDVDVMRGGFVPLGSDWKFYDFPLEVKKRWSFATTGFWYGRTGGYEADNWVLAYEDVSTPAGTFKAYRIQRNWTFRFPTGGGARNGIFEWKDTVWYAPAAKLDVKYETTHQWLRDWELISLRLR